MWIHVPAMPSLPSCPSVPAAGDSIWDSDSLCRALAQSVTWRGKHSAANAWSQRCKRTPWMMLLCGTILPPSTAARGVEAWIASLAATRARISALPVAERVWRGVEGAYGKAFAESLRKWGRSSASSRTSQGTFGWDSGESSQTWKSWVTQCRSRSLSRRQRLAQATGENACSSWLTPAVGMLREGITREGVMRTLQHGGQIHLSHQAMHLWPTASAHDGRRPGSDATSTQGANLKRDAECWPTARGTDGDSFRSRGGDRKDEPGLDRQARTMWPTAEARDHKGSVRLGSRDRMMWTLDEAAEQRFPSSRPDPATGTDGSDSSQNAPTSHRRLNALFVEWLMGWPPEWTGSGCSATELSRYRLRMQSQFCWLVTCTIE